MAIMTKVSPSKDVILSKDELERKKLDLEIQELERKWWQRPAYLSILLPVVIAALTVLAGILSGYFNQERKQLTRDIQALKKEKDALTQNAKTLAVENEKALEQVNKLDVLNAKQTADYEKALEQLHRLNAFNIKLNEKLNEVLDSDAGEPKIKPKPSPTPN